MSGVGGESRWATVITVVSIGNIRRYQGNCVGKAMVVSVVVTVTPVIWDWNKALSI